MSTGVFRRPFRSPPPSQNLAALSAALVGPVNATLAATEGDDTLSATATLDILASLAVTESDDGASAAGTVDIVASTAITDAGDALASNATLDILANVAVTEADDVPSLAGAVGIVGSLAATEQDDTFSADAALGIAAIALIAEGDDALDASALMPIGYPRRGGTDDREDYERWLRQWQENLRRIIDQAWAIANGLIDPVTLEPIPPADFDSLADALVLIHEARYQAQIDAMMADETKRQEEEAIAVLLLAA